MTKCELGECIRSFGFILKGIESSLQLMLSVSFHPPGFILKGIESHILGYGYVAVILRFHPQRN